MALQSPILGDKKKPYTFRFHEKLIEKVRELGEEEIRDLTNFIETILIKFVKSKKK